MGLFDGKEIFIYPVIEDLKKEGKTLEFFLGNLDEFEDSFLVGYNVLHFDIPYLVYKAEDIEKYVDLTRFKIIDLFWILPYWLNNIPEGIAFVKRIPDIGNPWSLSKVVEHILKEKLNPISSIDVFRLWETKRFNDIEKHLKLDLIHTFSFFKSSMIQETLNHIQRQHIDKSSCQDFCPFRHFLQKSSDRATSYCTLLQDVLLDERKLSAIDVIDYPLPRKDVFWVPHCLELQNTLRTRSVD